MKFRAALLLLLVMSVVGCSSPLSEVATNECERWSIGLVAPKHMEAWAEALYVKNERDQWVQMGAGVVSELGQTEGWDPDVWMAPRDSRASVRSPKEIYVRWQSLVEPQAYYWHFKVPESMQQALVKRERVIWRGRAEWVCRSDIAIGIAPGGRTVVWIDGGGLPRVEIQRGQATVVPEGPYQGQSGGKFRPMHDAAKQYVETHRIPYGSW
ncbi:DUF2931 family protein [Dyella sp. ASV21]|uniref:DUF2931 family protein n=1 Tax=Dyella sp. ASV21 TaxID=2795114 RepID=UPI0018ECE88D|nr:DUF2931 family protein [Dyella sp. ASV21]